MDSSLRAGLARDQAKGRRQQPCGHRRLPANDWRPAPRGRYSDERDGPNGPLVVVINQTMARTYWPGEEALGARIRFGDGGPAQPPYTIIGIVGDVKQMGLDAPSRPEMYFPVTQQAPGGSFFWPRTLVVRTAGDPYGLVADIRRAITEVDPDQPVANIRTMNEVLDSEVSGRKIQTTILTAFAISALLLASVGLHGVLSYTVAQRTGRNRHPHGPWRPTWRIDPRHRHPSIALDCDRRSVWPRGSLRPHANLLRTPVRCQTL